VNRGCLVLVFFLYRTAKKFSFSSFFPLSLSPSPPPLSLSLSRRLHINMCRALCAKKEIAKRKKKKKRFFIVHCYGSPCPSRGRPSNYPSSHRELAWLLLLLPTQSKHFLKTLFLFLFLSSLPLLSLSLSHTHTHTPHQM